MIQYCSDSPHKYMSAREHFFLQSFAYCVQTSLYIFARNLTRGTHGYRIFLEPFCEVINGSPTVLLLLDSLCIINRSPVEPGEGFNPEVPSKHQHCRDHRQNPMSDAGNFLAWIRRREIILGGHGESLVSFSGICQRQGGFKWVEAGVWAHDALTRWARHCGTAWCWRPYKYSQAGGWHELVLSPWPG